MRSSLLIIVLSGLALTASAAVATPPSHHRPTATVVPNGTSCPLQNTQPEIPPDGKTAIMPDSAHGSAPATAPIITGNTICRPTGSDAATNIARGNALAKPEPLNSPTLITPRH